MFAYDKTFDLKVVLGQYDVILRFSDFPLYLGTQLVYEHTSLTICDFCLPCFWVRVLHSIILFVPFFSLL